VVEHPNAGVLRKGFEAFSKRDTATLTDLFSEGIVGHVAGSSPFSGEHRGRDAWFAVLRRIGELNGGTWRSEVHDIVGNDTHAVALTRAAASREGKQLDLLGSHVYHVRGGEVTEARWFWQD
jgi:ketosteroid isomerase-like protein